MTAGADLHGVEVREAARPRFWHEGRAAELANSDAHALEFVTIPSPSPRTNSASGFKSRMGWLVGTLFMSGIFGATAYVAWATEPGQVAGDSPSVPIHTVSPEPTTLAPILAPASPASINSPQSQKADAPGATPPALKPMPPVEAALPPQAPVQGEHRPRHRARQKPARAALPTIAIDAVAGTHGMGPLDIRMGVDPLREQLRQCHAKAIAQGLVTGERLTVKMTLRGAVIESIAPVGTPRSPTLWHCLRTVLFQAAFKTAPPYAEATLVLQLGPR